MTEQLASGEYGQIDPNWSPDGNSLIFGEDPDHAMSHSSDAIHLLDLKTRQFTTIPGSAHLFSPRWSPDGRWLLAMTPTSDYKLKLYDFSTRKWQDFSDLQSAYPNWSADSKCVIFTSTFVNDLPVYRVCLADRKPQLVVNLKQIGSLSAREFGPWTGLTPDGSILGLRDISTEEIYALHVKFP